MKANTVLHFRLNDPLLFAVYQKIIARFGPFREISPREPFVSLCNQIICQQLSEKTGDTIYSRFSNLMDGIITPGKVAALRDEQIRLCGLSWSKVKYIKNLSEQIMKNKINLEKIKELGNEEVITELVKLKGIGRWTAEMYLMFTLGREDVFSYGDLGLIRGIQKIYKFKNKPTEKQIKKIISKWSPFKTHACRILWASTRLDV